MKNIKLFFETIFLTFFYSGKMPFGPGTFGSIFSFIFLLVLLFIFNVSLYIIIIITLFISLISIPIINNYEKRTKKHDNSSIVIDEFIGVFITSIIILFFTNNIFILFIGLFLFRVFDILKPGYIGYIDKNLVGGPGVVLDDVLAGIVAGIISVIIYLFLNNIGII